MNTILGSSVKLAKRQVKLIAGVAAGLLVGGAGTAVVLASVPDTTGTIHACYANSGGQMRIIDSPSQTCSGSETAVSWNSATSGQLVTNLAGSDFSGADLRYRNFSGADLHDSVFEKTVLVGANFKNANLSGTSFDQTVYGPSGERQSVKISFKGANLSHAKFLDAIAIEESDFSDANFGSALLDDGTSFYNSNFSNVDFRTATFNGHSSPTALFNSSDLSNADFSNQDLSGFDLQGNNATGTDFTSVDFTNTNLNNTDLSNATLTNVVWSNTTCPDNTNSDNNGGTCVGHLVP